MQQSLAFSTDFYEGVHFLIAKNQSEASIFDIVKTIGFDIASFYIPLGNGWMHEEWHRAVLSKHGYGSFNDMNTLPFGQNIVAVSHVEDKDLLELNWILRVRPSVSMNAQSFNACNFGRKSLGRSSGSNSHFFEPFLPGQDPNSAGFFFPIIHMQNIKAFMFWIVLMKKIETGKIIEIKIV